MRRAVAYGLLVLSLLALGKMPFWEKDVGRLLPVETLLVAQEEGEILIRTDLNLRGRGESLTAALQDLEEKAAGKVFYDTSSTVLLHDSAVFLENILAEQDFLRGSCGICRVSEVDLDLEAAGAYLLAHESPVSLRQVAAAAPLGRTLPLPELRLEKEGFSLVSGETA